MRQSADRRPLTGEINVGATIGARLAEVGIRTVGDLRRVGPVAAFGRLRVARAGSTMPVCYYLYSLQGALDGVRWDALPETTKARLRRTAGESFPAPRQRPRSSGGKRRR